jgi:5-dehydro-2-deoxygluconokinase
MACGTARLGLKSALITRVGDEHMGRFIREQLEREGVDTRGVITDPERLTALVLLGIRDSEQFPLIFYRENCADMALCEDDIDPEFHRQARAWWRRAPICRIRAPKPRAQGAEPGARTGGARTALDIDYRPNLWGWPAMATAKAASSPPTAVTAKLQSTLHLFDLIVGTEEEFHIAGGTTDTFAALRAVRAVSGATLVCKRGPMGAVGL